MYKKPLKRTEQELKAFAYWREHPVDAIKDWFKCTPDDWQGDILNLLLNPKFANVDRVAMKACHGPGKTTIDAWAGWIFLNCFANCRVVATAPTMAQLSDVLFPEFNKWANKFPDRIKDEWLLSAGHIRHKINPMDWFAVARTSNRPENLQGFHGTDLLILADEASAIAPNVFEIMEGALSEAGEEHKVAKLLMGGNPNFNSGELHDAFYKNRDLYHRVTITGDIGFLASIETLQGQEHPDHGRAYYSPRVKKKYVDTIIKKYGKDSAVFDVRVRGIFPRASDDSIFPLEWAERAALLPLPSFDPRADGFSVVVDPSRGGAAETAIGIFRKGICIEINGYKGLTSSIQVANRAHEQVLKYQGMGLHLNEIIVDQPGVGGGVIDNLRRDFNHPVRGYDGGKPLVTGVDPEDDCKMFQNRRARDHWQLRRKLEQGNYPIPADDFLVAQMATVHYSYNKQEKIQVEGKQDMKDRLGDEASPDRSDVMVMGSAPFYSAGTTSINIADDDIISGLDRATTQYREEMDMGLV